MAILLVFMVCMYFLPAVVALCSGLRSAGAVTLLNLLLGWTFVGWVAALVWAFAGETQQQADAKVIDYNKLAAAMRGRQAPQQTSPCPYTDHQYAAYLAGSVGRRVLDTMRNWRRDEPTLRITPTD